VEKIDWRGEMPNDCVAFSGWKRVDETFRLKDVSVEVREILRTHLSINLAIRLPQGSLPSPANAFWRKLVLTWDE